MQQSEHPCFTPHGILQNPYHVFPDNPSGIIRSFQAIGIGWVVGFKWYFNEQDAIYSAIIKVGVGVDDKLFYEEEDFRNSNIHICSKHHSKNILSYDWEYGDLIFSFMFFLSDKNSISCKVIISNRGNRRKTVMIHSVANLAYKEEDLRGWYEESHDSIVITAPSLPIFITLGCSEESLSYDLAPSEDVIKKFMKVKEFKNLREFTCKSFMYGLMSYEITIERKAKKELFLSLGRGSDKEEAIRNLKTSLNRSNEVLKQKVKEDLEFWNKAPKLVGDWPLKWVRGFIYDYETLRMCVNKPIGVFKHRWDIMHVNRPRNVVAETSIDMLMMSYADMETAKDVILGLYEDSLEPNVPCVYADGKFNLIAKDGSKCGTSPAWCFPFYDYMLIYLRCRDKEWLRKVYGYWSNYLRWWLDNRTDEEGWLHYKCSWESGEDLAPRFGPQTHGSDLIEHVRASELQAVMAHAAKTMIFYSKELGLDEREIKYWEDIHAKYYQKLQEMWVDGWFHDYDVKAKRFTRYKDPLHISPVFLRLATKEQSLKVLSDIDRKLEDFKESTAWPALIWPSFTFPIMEALHVAGDLDKSLKENQSRIIYQLINKIYDMEDSRVRSAEKPLPGVSYEHWGYPEVSAKAVEGYGWGALAVLLIIRYVIGYVEDYDFKENSFLISPNFNEEMIGYGKTYGIDNLNFKDIMFSIYYRFLEHDSLLTIIKYRADKPYSIKILDMSGNTIAYEKTRKERGEIRFHAQNRKTYRVIFEG